MMKKLLITALISLSFISLVGCGNKDIIGTTFTFKYAKIKLVDGQIVEGKVKQWAKYDDQDSVRVTLENGEVYYTHSSNVTLYNK
jgi:lipoprotein